MQVAFTDLDYLVFSESLLDMQINFSILLLVFLRFTITKTILLALSCNFLVCAHI